MACRYSDRKLPLDLENGVAWSEPETLKAALDDLDEDGWNTGGHIWPSSMIRARYGMAVMKEKVMEHSLAGVPDQDAADKLQYVSFKFPIAR
jgi:hypothetical protein